MDNDSETERIIDKKVFNDPIHGHIELHPLLVKVIDTPQFQRLRNVKQLGANYFVYPGASHNRFEHCIGTCHLAGKLARHLKEIHGPEMVNDRDILCVELAGLCHDLGHGPFSHMFDLKFLPKANPGVKWQHEKGSCDMLDYLFEDNELKEDFTKHKLLIPQDLVFIKEMINGYSSDVYNHSSADNWPYEGRDRNKSFLYEIVSNERNKVDVDKWDYFARDCYHLGIKNSFDHTRFMKFLKVLTVEGEDPQICARDKEAFNLYEMFSVRTSLHRAAYQHKCKGAIENMICDALLLANNHVKYKGRNEEMRSIADTVTDMVAFSKLSDHVFYQILYSTDNHEDMKKARAILERILKRDLYKFVDKCKPPREATGLKSDDIEKEIAEMDDSVSPDDLVVNIKKYNFGMKDKNPCDQFRFYSKKDPKVPYQIRREDISLMLPEIFEDCEIQVFCKSNDMQEVVKCCLVNWCFQKGYKPPKAIESAETTLTPMKRPRNGVSEEGDDAVASKVLKFL